MNNSFTVFGLRTGLIRSGDSVADCMIAAAQQACGGFNDGDILVLAETAVATAEGNIIPLSTITPSAWAEKLAAQYQMDPRVVEVVLQETDSVVGGIPGFLLCMKQWYPASQCRGGCIKCPAGLRYSASGKSGPQCSRHQKSHRSAVQRQDRCYHCRQPDTCNASRVQWCCHRLRRDYCGD